MAKKKFIGEDGKEYVAKLKKPFYKRFWFWVIAVIVFLSMSSVLMAAIASSTSSYTASEEVTTARSTSNNETNKTVSESKIKEAVTKSVANLSEDHSGDSNVPTEYKSALTKADTYANQMYMSKQGLYDQLTSEYGERFTPEAAQYAIDNVKADWNNNALEKAKTYQNDMAMSPNAIYDQLISEYGEQFTPEEAQYAVNNLK